MSKVTRGGLKQWRGGGRFNYTTFIPAGLKVKVRPDYADREVKEYFLEDLSIFKSLAFELHDATHYGVVLTEEEVMDGN